VVATSAGGIPDAVVEGETGRLVPPRDHRALAQALVDTLSSASTLERFGAAGRGRFLRELTSVAMVQATLAAYGRS
jgi:glycosyltransferase involved in cell wall biosynthesis